MQIICTFSIYFFINLDNEDPGTISMETPDFIMICCFIEHIFSYICAYYRKNDIAKNGKYDINGVKRAVNESKLGSI